MLVTESGLPDPRQAIDQRSCHSRCTVLRL